jgi:MYXO-CTERM domain-containing protein
MSASRRFRIIALLTAAVLVAALVAPVVTFAGEPVPGAEVFLQQQPDGCGYWLTRDDGSEVWISLQCPDDTIAPVGGGTVGFGDSMELGDLTFPDGAVSSMTSVTVMVWNPRMPQTATDGRKVVRFVYLTASNPVFNTPVTLALTEVPGYVNQTIFGWNEVTDVWEPMAGAKARDARRVGDVKQIQIALDHFSWYGIGGDPVAITSTPASSSWSLALGTLGALGIALAVRRRKIAASR